MESKSIEAVVASMSGSLRKTYEMARELLAGASGEEVTGRYKVAVLAREVKRREKAYGEGAVRKLALALGWDRSTLYGYALVARRWDQAAMTALKTRRTVHGQPISWSHLMLVVRVSPPSRREALVERIFDEGLTVREVTRIVRASKKEARGRDAAPAGAEIALTRGLLRLARAAERYALRSEKLEELLRAIDDLQGEVPPAVTELLEAARKAHERVKEAAERMVSRLGAAEASAFATGRAVNESTTPPRASAVIRAAACG